MSSDDALDELELDALDRDELGLVLGEDELEDDELDEDESGIAFPFKRVTAQPPIAIG